MRHRRKPSLREGKGRRVARTTRCRIRYRRKTSRGRGHRGTITDKRGHRSSRRPTGAEAQRGAEREGDLADGADAAQGS